MSTDAQLKGDSLRRQLEKSSAYAREHGLEIDEQFDLRDIGLSAFDGSHMERGSLGKFLAAVRAGKIEKGSVLLIESFDRLSREQVTTALTVFLDLLNAGITIVTLTDLRRYEPSNVELPEIMMSLVVMSRAHEESLQKSDRLSAAWRAKRDRIAERKLTAKCPAWLRLNAQRTDFDLIPERVTIVRRIFEDCLSGMGGDVIARRLNEAKVPAFGRATGWHKSYVQKILFNDAVIGRYQPHRMVEGKRVPEGEFIPDYFPAVVDEAMFYAAKGGRESRRVGGGGRKGYGFSNLFTRLAVCGCCGSTMTYRNRGLRGGVMLVCDSVRRGLGCDAPSWNYRHFEASFLAFVRELDLLQFDPATSSEGSRRDQEQVLVLDGRLRELKRKRDRILDLLLDADVPDGSLKAKFKELELAISKYEGERAALLKTAEARVRQATDAAFSQATLHPLIAGLQQGDQREVYQVRSAIATRVRTLIKSVKLFPSETTICDSSAPQRFFVVEYRSGGRRSVWPHENAQSKEVVNQLRKNLDYVRVMQAMEAKRLLHRKRRF